jgi:hypothetical protein
MDSLIAGASGANRPLFQFSGQPDVSQSAPVDGQYMLSRPSEKLDAAHWPVRGDLAHIRLAGRCFVPHYAVPMPRTVVADGAKLLCAGDPQADLREELAGGTLFNVLDMTGGWAWGQVGEDGCVGYLPVSALES